MADGSERILFAEHLEGEGAEIRERAGVMGVIVERSVTVKPMKIATYNVNGVNGRLPVLLRWLKEAQPDIVCLQESRAPQGRVARLVKRMARPSASGICKLT